MKRYHMLIKGKVQGVLFRDFARIEAEKLNLAGYAKNLESGEVEIIAEGNETDLQKYVKVCRKGPLLAFVHDIEIKESPATSEFDGFDIRY